MKKKLTILTLGILITSTINAYRPKFENHTPFSVAVKFHKIGDSADKTAPPRGKASYKGPWYTFGFLIRGITVKQAQLGDIIIPIDLKQTLSPAVAFGPEWKLDYTINDEESITFTLKRSRLRKSFRNGIEETVDTSKRIAFDQKTFKKILEEINKGINHERKNRNDIMMESLIR